MTLTISVVAVLGVLVILLCRYAGLRIWHAPIRTGGAAVGAAPKDRYES